jgi:diaminohydroxyphosphoribosylaminopyrimidine deaminase/5-amino-6-(5-phosphoribosylamino)uracil reductase
MKRAIELARNGKGNVHPNPLVGAVIVKDEKVIGEGYHEVYGSAHAEVNAISNAKEEVFGSTMYVTLEPCSHYGKTPPCTKLIIDKGIKKVIIGSLDPNPLVAGKGVEMLEQAGIEVEVGCLEEECLNLNKRFFKYVTTKLPYVVYKTAMTLDGRMKTSSGHSKWISNEKSREYVHQLRGELKGIMVGVNTIIKDNPTLNNRSGKGKNPLRIIVDSKLRIPLDSIVVTDENETIIYTTNDCDKSVLKTLSIKENVEVMIVSNSDRGVDLVEVLSDLGRRGIDGVLLEGGANLATSMLKDKLIDELQFFYAPKIVGGFNNTVLGDLDIGQMSDAIKVINIKYQTFDDDLLMKGDVQYVYRDC